MLFSIENTNSFISFDLFILIELGKSGKFEKGRESGVEGGGGVIEWGVHEGLLSGIYSYLNALLAMYRKLKVNALTIRYRS